MGMGWRPRGRHRTCRVQQDRGKGGIVSLCAQMGGDQRATRCPGRRRRAAAAAQRGSLPGARQVRTSRGQGPLDGGSGRVWARASKSPWGQARGDVALSGGPATSDDGERRGPRLGHGRPARRARGANGFGQAVSGGAGHEGRVRGAPRERARPAPRLRALLPRAGARGGRGGLAVIAPGALHGAVGGCVAVEDHVVGRGVGHPAGVDVAGR